MTRRTVLIIDDDADLREAVRDALEQAGHRVLEAANGRAALELLRGASERPDLILLDMMMPEMDGPAFRREQLEDPELAGIRTIVFTAYGAASDGAEQLSADGALEKPVSLSRLLAAIERG